MWRRLFLLRRYYTKTTTSLSSSDYKALTDRDYLNYLQKLKVVNYGRKHAPKAINFRELELHNIEKISKNPKLAIELIPEYLELDKGTEDGLKEMCDIVVKQFDKLVLEPSFEQLLSKLSNWTMALNPELLGKSAYFLQDSLYYCSPFAS